MKLIQGILYTVLILLNVSYHVSAVPEVYSTAIRYHHLRHKPHFIQDEDFYVSPGQVFGTCYEMILLRKKVKVKCTFIMETTEVFSSPDHLRVCNFTLKSVTEYDKKNYYTPLKVTAIDENKAFLIMTYRDHRRFFLLHFADCRAVEVKVGTKNPIVAAPNDDVFDIIMAKDEQGYCKSKYCRMVLDTEGKVVVEKYDWLHEDSDIIAIAPSPRVGNLVVDRCQKQWKNSYDGLVRIYNVNEDGSINIIKQYQAQAGPGVHYGAITTSTTDQLLTVISTNKKNFTYAQFDWDGNVKFDGVWKNDKVSLIHTLRVHNLPDGGFVLVMTICYKEHNIRQCKKNGDNIFIKKFDKFKKELGTIDITSWRHIEVKKLHFYVNRDNKMCLSHANGHDVPHDGTIFFNVICFEDADFASVYL